MERGIIVACDQKLEWILTWWWDHYSAHNDYPVIFFDFGMSSKAKIWCEKKGQLKVLDPAHQISLPKERLDLKKRILWEAQYGEGIWEVRAAWLQKPMTLLQSPFSIGLWLDLDCRVDGNLKPLFDTLQEKDDFAVMKYEIEDSAYKHPDMWNYNSAVILFRQHAEILKIWAQRILESPNELPGDEDYLSRVIERHHPKVLHLPPFYNWSRTRGDHDQALVVHFHGGEGKILVLNSIHRQL